VSGQPAQLVVHERQQLAGGMAITLLDCRQDACRLVHRLPA
jgi:hypothetical protein